MASDVDGTKKLTAIYPSKEENDAATLKAYEAPYIVAKKALSPLTDLLSRLDAGLAVLAKKSDDAEGSEAMHFEHLHEQEHEVVANLRSSIASLEQFVESTTPKEELKFQPTHLVEIK